MNIEDLLIKLEKKCNKQVYIDFVNVGNDTKKIESVANRIMFDTPPLVFKKEEKEFLLQHLLEKIENSDQRKVMLERIQNRPSESIALLRENDFKLFQKFMKFNTAEDFEKLPSCISNIKKCPFLDSTDQEKLISDLEKRKDRLTKEDTLLHDAKKELKEKNRDLSKQYFKFVMLSKEQQNRLIEKISNHSNLSLECKKAILKDLTERNDKKQPENSPTMIDTNSKKTDNFLGKVTKASEIAQKNNAMSEVSTNKMDRDSNELSN
ncbi:MAG: hypothetical protein IC227_00645 [Enterococcus lacertideformus]|uniref:Uncharacterized protein n=1 Tax=Enterococcus lacertideformus TaxID=2771493 RepID=A0A931FB39_9ENTE|nr:hypothetical protein [Enterococcus lacertideformus]